MSERDELDELSEALGRKVRAIRTANGKTQGDVAAAAVGWGLAWAQPIVAALETGRRDLTALELLVLPLVLAEVGGGSHTLAELLEDVPDMIGTPNGETLSMEVLRRIARGERPQEVAAAWEQFRGAVDELDDLLARAARREPERHAARALDVHPARVLRFAYQLWGQGLTEERDARLAARGDGSGDDPRRRQALRGHVTRELLAELRQAMEGHNG